MNFLLFLAVLSCLLPATVRSADPHADAASIIPWLLDEERDLKGIPFPEVIKATSGKTLIPIDPTRKTDQELLTKIGRALDRVVREMNRPESPAHQQRRINEVSAHFESAIRAALNAVPGFACDVPKTAAGKIQRSGYPDLRLEDRMSGRVVYLDPKLYEQKSRASSLRTFYFEPKKATNKVLDDAHHLLIGFAHGGRQDDRWNFQSWEMVDLAKFRVRLKAEFQGSNRDLYQPQAIVGRSGK